MAIENIPLPIAMIIATLILALAVEVGYRIGDAVHRHTEDEKESPVSATAGAILGLLAFVLAFTFAIVSDRYDTRRALVRDEANAVRTAFMRSEFLPEPERAEAMRLLQEYVDIRLSFVASGDLEQLEAAVVKSVEIQDQLWNMAVDNARLDMNSDVAALYIESLNEIANVHALRVVIGAQTRIPNVVWLMLFSLLLMGMAAVGYQTAISGSRRSWTAVVLAISFSIVLTLIAALNRPDSDLLPVSQQALENVKAFMAAGLQNR